MNIEVNINLQSIDSVLNAEERETFRKYVAERLEAQYDDATVTVSVRAADSRAYIDGKRSYEIEGEVNDAFDSFCSA